MSEQELKQQMEDMRRFDEPMPQVGIFWYNPEDKSLFGVRKLELTPKTIEEAADKGLPFINYPRLHRQVWAKEFFHAQAKHEVTKFKGDYTNEFALPYFEFVYDEHWDLGHGWSGDL